MEEKVFFEQIIKNVKSNKELTLMYNRIMDTNLSVDAIRKKANALGFHIKDNIGTNDLRSKGHLEWIESNKDKYETTTELHKAYNKHFNSNIKHASFVYILKNVIRPKNKIEYTEEETQWFKNNVHNFYSRLAVKYAFNKQFNKNLTIDEINRKIGYMKLHCSRPPKKEKVKIVKPKKIKEPKPKVIPPQCISMFSQEQQDWLRNSANNYALHKDVYKAFQKEFNTSFTQQQVVDRMHRMRIKIKKNFKYTTEELQWIYSNYNRKQSSTELAKEFKEKFNKEIYPSRLRGLCNKKNLYKDLENYACNVPVLPIWSERISDNRIFIKISDKKGSRNNKVYHENWVPKSRYIWEQHYGKIPKGHYICFKDGNSLNCELSNLFLASQSELSALSKNKVYGYGEYTDAYLDMIRLEKELLKDVKEYENK